MAIIKSMPWGLVDTRKSWSLLKPGHADKRCHKRRIITRLKAKLYSKALYRMTSLMIITIYIWWALAGTWLRPGTWPRPWHIRNLRERNYSNQHRTGPTILYLRKSQCGKERVVLTSKLASNFIGWFLLNWFSHTIKLQFTFLKTTNLWIYDCLAFVFACG